MKLIYKHIGAILMLACGGTPVREGPSTSSSTVPIERDMASGDATGHSARSAHGTQHMEDVYPRITLANRHGTMTVTHRFMYESTAERVSLKVAKNLYEGARQSPKYILSVQEKTGIDWRQTYHEALIFDPNQKAFFDALLERLRARRSQLNLDSDRWVDYLVSFVQHIPYDEADERDPRFPVETFGDKRGDCDDKARLLLGLLAEEGFDVAAFHFDPEQHMAVGIRANALPYRDTGYTYIETTSPSMIGFPFADTATVKLSSRPQVVPIGRGKRRYNSAHEVAFLANVLLETDDDLARRETMLARIDRKLKAARQVVADNNRQIASLPETATDRRAAAVDDYNTSVALYNDLVSEQRKQVADINIRVRIRNFIVENAQSRYTTYRWVKSMLSTIDGSHTDK